MGELLRIAAQRPSREIVAARRLGKKPTKRRSVRASNTFASHALLELRFSPGVRAYSFTFG